jgi:hypothetical protein
MSGHINVNENSNPVGKTQKVYASLSSSTSGANTPQLVLNPKDASYSVHRRAFNTGKLHPNQSVIPGSYHNISSAYGAEPIRLYTTRDCGSSNVM